MIETIGLNPEKEKSDDLVPEDEIEINFVRSSGKGGQNVNKLSTKAQLRWNVLKSKAFSDEEKEKIISALQNRITKEGDLILESEEERSQLQNKEIVIKRLNNLIQAALMPMKERVETKPTRAGRERRLEEKRLRAQKKKQRSWSNNYE